jgi:DNA-binding XRE family transcriptional regulator
VPQKITADNLRKIRTDAGMTQAEVGAILGVNKEVICKIETGSRTLTTAESMVLSAALLGRKIPQLEGLQAV